LTPKRPIAASYSPADPKPLSAYAGITGVFAGAVACSEMRRRKSGPDLPDRIELGDLALLTVATYKLSRLVTKARVTSFARAPFTRYTGEAGPSEVSEEPRGEGLRRAIGELAVCPYCVGEWIAAGLVAAYLRDPRSVRIGASVLAVVAASDVLHQGWIALDEKASVT
jgi:hypothetical protein